MEPRDLKILKHVGLYRISLRPVLDKLFFGGKTCGNVVHRLIVGGYLQWRDGLPKNLNYYQLTAATAADLGLPTSRAGIFGPQALHTHLSILWFCCMMDVPRHRLESQPPKKNSGSARVTLERLFGSDVPLGDHCVEEAPADPASGDEVQEAPVKAAAIPRIYNVYVPGPGVKLGNVLREIRERLGEVRARPEPARWLQARCYALAVLVETPERRAALRAALREASDDHGPLLKQAHIRVDVVPGLRTIGQVTRESDE